jgi:hypothetical protein
MKKNLFLFLLLTLFVFQFNLSLRAQIFSEAPVTVSNKGERLSNMIYVKFKPGDLIDIPKDKKDADGNSISNKFSDIRKTFSDFCKNRQFDLPDLKISKAIANAKDEDTLFIDVKTGEIKKLPNLARVFIIKFPKQVDIETITSELSRHKEVEYAHGPVQLVNCAEYPNDQYYTNGGQWYLNTISAPEAWGITKGSNDVKIGLIETSGVELTHSDLQSKIAGGDNNPYGIIGPHGTWVAGFSGAVTNNGTPGVASLGWNIKLLTYQPPELDDDYRTGLAQKIKDAADAGAHVINLSFKTLKYGFTSCSLLRKTNGTTNSILLPTYYYNWDYSLVRDAITYAVGKNIVVVASAGNTTFLGDILPCENIPYPCYPAQYSNVIAVSGSQQNNNFVDGWNYGSFIDVNAPGRTDANTGLWSTDRNNSYTNDINKTSGTSFAAPQVSALVALMKSLNNSLTPSQIKTILENTAEKVGQYSYNGGRNNYFGYGRINASTALKYTLENYGGTLTQNVVINDSWAFNSGTNVNLNGYSIVTTGGSITVNSGATISGLKTYLKSGTTIKGLFPSIQSAINYAVANQTVELLSTSYSESPSFSSKSYITINGLGSGSSILNGNISVTNSDHIYIQSMRVNGTITANSSQLTYVSSNVLSAATVLNDYYSTQLRLSSSTATDGTASFAFNSYGGTGDIFSNTISYYDCAIYLTSSASYNVGTNNLFCSNGYDIYSPSPSYAYAISNNYSRTVQQAVYGNVFITGVNGVCGMSKAIAAKASESNSINSKLLKDADEKYLALLRKIDEDTKKDKYDKNKYVNDFSTLIEDYKNIINLEKEIHTIKAALSKLHHLYKAKEDKNSFNNYLTQLSNNKEYEQFVPYIERYFIWKAVDNKDYDNSIAVADEIIKTANYDEDLTCEMLYEKGLIYKYYLDNKNKAEEMFAELITKYPQNLLAEYAAVETGIEREKLGNYNVTEFKQIEDYSIDNYPNPFNPSTRISFTIPRKGNVKLRVFDVLGREVANLVDGFYEVGKYEVTFDASKLSSGVYFYNLTTGSNSISKKMLLVK